MNYDPKKLDLVFYEIKEHVYNRLPDTRLQSTSLRIESNTPTLKVNQMYSINPSFTVCIGISQRSKKLEENMWVVRRLHGFCDRGIDGMIFSILHEIGHIYDEMSWEDDNYLQAGLARKVVKDMYRHNEMTSIQCRMNYRSWEIEKRADLFAIEEITTDRKFYEELSKFLMEVE